MSLAQIPFPAWKLNGAAVVNAIQQAGSVDSLLQGLSSTHAGQLSYHGATAPTPQPPLFLYISGQGHTKLPKQALAHSVVQGGPEPWRSSCLRLPHAGMTDLYSRARQTQVSNPKEQPQDHSTNELLAASSSSLCFKHKSRLIG